MDTPCSSLSHPSLTLHDPHARRRAVDSKDIVTDAVEFKRFDLATVKKEELEFHSAFTLKLSNGKGACRRGSEFSCPGLLFERS